MFGSGILDTVIGLVFIFLLVSMFVTIINEIIASVFKSRAKWLRRGIDRLIGSAWMKQVYEHPLIKGKASRDDSWFRDPGPSYIPSRSFANVLMSVVQQNAGQFAECQAALRRALDEAAGAGATVDSLVTRLSAAASRLGTAGPAQQKVAADLVRHLDARPGPDLRGWLDEVGARVNELRLSGRQGITPLLDDLAKLVADGKNAELAIDVLRQRFDTALTTLLTTPATQALKDELSAMGKRLQGPYTVADAYADIRWFVDGISTRYVREMIEAIPDDQLKKNDQLKKSLLTLYEDAGHEIEKFKENIEVWFNNGMDRVNGWYKRRVQWVTLVVALVTALAMNVDAILIFRHLQTYAGAREGLVALATQFAQKNPAPISGSLAVANGETFSGTVPLTPSAAPRTVEITTSNPKAITVTPQSIDVTKDTREIKYTVDVHIPETDPSGTATIDFGGAATPVTLRLGPSLLRQLDAVQEKLMNLAIPIGWVDAAKADAKKPVGQAGADPETVNGQVLPRQDHFCHDSVQLLKQHGLGWLLTALAATLGAPFWFDMLNRIISIRAAGKPPEEEPKPPKTVSVPVEPGQSQREADRIRQGDPHRR